MGAFRACSNDEIAMWPCLNSNTTFASFFKKMQKGKKNDEKVVHIKTKKNFEEEHICIHKLEVGKTLFVFSKEHEITNEFKTRILH